MNLLPGVYAPPDVTAKPAVPGLRAPRRGMASARIVAAVAACVLVGIVPHRLFAQEPTQGQGAFAVMTSDERGIVESRLRSDERIRQIVGPGDLRIILSDPSPDKTESQAYLAGESTTLPSRRVTAIVFNVRTNLAARAIVALEQRRILAVAKIPSVDVPLVREDVVEAFALARQNAQVLRSIGPAFERYRIAEPGEDTRAEEYVAQALPVRSVDRRDPCSVDRCLDLVFRTPSGYLPLRVHVDLTKRTVALEGRTR